MDGGGGFVSFFTPSKFIYSDWAAQAGTGLFYFLRVSTCFHAVIGLGWVFFVTFIDSFLGTNGF